MVMRGNAYLHIPGRMHIIIIVSQGFIQDFSKGGGELNDVHPLNLCSLMRIAIEGPNLIDIPIEESLEKNRRIYPFNYIQLLSLVFMLILINFADLKGGGGGGGV